MQKAEDISRLFKGIKIQDFGVSKNFQDEMPVKEFFGVAREVVKVVCKTNVVV